MTRSFGLLVALAALGPAQGQEALYPSSVVGTDFDVITDEDPDVFEALDFQGQQLAEMPDKTREAELRRPAFVFEARYTDGARIQIAVGVEIGSEDAAREEASRYTSRLGRLPSRLRHGVERLVVHAGEEDATAFSDVGLIVVYAPNATQRIATHDLEETLFHESVHAVLDPEFATGEAWREAQARDGRFATRYGERNPVREDLAESALFAFALLHHEDRIPAAERARIRAAIPHRIAFFEGVFPPGEPLQYDRRETPRETEAQESTGTSLSTGECEVDLESVGQLSDVLSNALILGLGQHEPDVFAFLEAEEAADAAGLVDAAAARFGVDRARLWETVLEYRHCNCEHGEGR